MKTHDVYDRTTNFNKLQFDDYLKGQHVGAFYTRHCAFTQRPLFLVADHRENPDKPKVLDWYETGYAAAVKWIKQTDNRINSKA